MWYYSNSNKIYPFLFSLIMLHNGKKIQDVRVVRLWFAPLGGEIAVEIKIKIWSSNRVTRCSLANGVSCWLIWLMLHLFFDYLFVDYTRYSYLILITNFLWNMYQVSSYIGVHHSENMWTINWKNLGSLISVLSGLFVWGSFGSSRFLPLPFYFIMLHGALTHMFAICFSD